MTESVSPARRKASSARFSSKNSSLRYRLTTSPTASLVLISARLPFTLIRLVRIPLYIIEEGSSGTALPRNLSSRCPASFCPIVNSFIYDSFFYARRLAKMSSGCVSPLTGASPIPSGASLPAGLPCRPLIFFGRPPSVLFSKFNISIPGFQLTVKPHRSLLFSAGMVR